MTKLSAILISFSFLISSCNENKERFTRQSKPIATERFFGITNKIDSSKIVQQMSKDISVAFNIPEIKKSTFEYEVRVYYADVFKERFFQQIFKNDFSNIKLYNCKTERREDSLFMKSFHLLIAAGRAAYDSLPNTNLIPKYIIRSVQDTLGSTLDAGNLYYIEVKNKDEVKYALINNLFEKKIIDKAGINHVVDFISSIEKKYSINFNESWSVIDSSAVNRF